MTLPRLVGLSEISELLDVSKRTATRYASRGDFPDPVARLASGPVWLEDDIQSWARRTLPLPEGVPGHATGSDAHRPSRRRSR